MDGQLTPGYVGLTFRPTRIGTYPQFVRTPLPDVSTMFVLCTALEAASFTTEAAKDAGQTILDELASEVPRRDIPYHLRRDSDRAWRRALEEFLNAAIVFDELPLEGYEEGQAPPPRVYIILEESQTLAPYGNRYTTYEGKRAFSSEPAALDALASSFDPSRHIVAQKPLLGATQAVLTGTAAEAGGSP